MRRKFALLLPIDEDEDHIHRQERQADDVGDGLWGHEHDAHGEEQEPQQNTLNVVGDGSDPGHIPLQADAQGDDACHRRDHHGHDLKGGVGNEQQGGIVHEAEGQEVQDRAHLHGLPARSHELAARHGGGRQRAQRHRRCDIGEHAPVEHEHMDRHGDEA